MRTSRVSRRKFLTIAGATAGAAVALGVTARATHASPLLAKPDAKLDARSIEPALPTPSASYLGLRPGQKMGRWTIASVGPVLNGAVPVTMATEHGHQFRVDVVRREPGTSGIVDTRQVSLFLINGGSGSTASDEEQGLGAMMLGRHLEIHARRGYGLPAELLTYSQRRRAFPWRERA